MDRDKALKVLEFSQEATREEVVQRYHVLLKRHRINQQEEANSVEDTRQDKDQRNDQTSLNDLNEAYDSLMGYETEIIEPTKPSTLSPLYQRLHLDEKKIRNFIYYNKVWMIVTLIAAIIIGVTIKDIVTRQPEDFSLAFISPAVLSDVEPVRQSLINAVPVLKNPVVEFVVLREKDMSDQAYAMNMKAMTLIAAGEVDLFILDKVNFQRYGTQGAFVNLEDLYDAAGVKREEGADYILKTESGSESHIYGIKVSGGSMLKSLGLGNTELIAAIRYNAKHADLAAEMIKEMLKP